MIVAYSLSRVNLWTKQFGFDRLFYFGDNLDFYVVGGSFWSI